MGIDDDNLTENDIKHINKTILPEDAIKACLQWEFGDPTWWEQIEQWAEDCGFVITEKPQENVSSENLSTEHLAQKLLNVEPRFRKVSP